MITVTPYPADSRISNEATALAAAGYRVSVICCAVSGQPLHESIDGVEIYRYRRRRTPSFEARVRTTARDDGSLRMPAFRRGSANYALAWGGATLAILGLCLRILARERVDVVHAHNPPDTLCIAALACKLAGARFVFDQHDLAPEMYLARAGDGARPLLYRLLRLMEQLSYRLADHVIATNESYRRLAGMRGGVPDQQITVVRNGPNLAGVPSSANGHSPRRGQTVGYAGIIGLQDGVDHLIRAMDELVHRLGRTDVRCLIIGAGDGLDAVRALVASLELEEHVTFAGWLPRRKLMERLGEVDVAVEPAPANAYTCRSTMIKIMEYMALGRPVVAFDLPEHRRTARSAALYAKPNDDSELARCIANLLEDADWRQQMGQFGRERVERQLAWSHNAPHLLHTYRHVLADASLRT